MTTPTQCPTHSCLVPVSLSASSCAVNCCTTSYRARQYTDDKEKGVGERRERGELLTSALVALASSTCASCSPVARALSRQAFSSTSACISALSPTILCWRCVVRVGSLCLNHPELVHKHPTHLASSVMVWFV